MAMDAKAEAKAKVSESDNDDTNTTVEINLRLDSDGRTACDPSLRPPCVAEAPNIDDIGQEEEGQRESKRPRRASTAGSIDYSAGTSLTNLSRPPSPGPSHAREAMDDLLFDAEIADCGHLPRTFWVPAAGAPPRCFLEKIALEVFRHHVPPNSDGIRYDPATSGAEWWVQIRPSPKGTGRYSMLAGDDGDCLTKAGMSFHWDKDEDLHLMCGGSMCIHPHISTVTYLTDLGAPTMVLSKRVDPMTGDLLLEIDANGDSSPVKGLVSWPKQGKHLSFDGRYLHAAPSDLMEEGSFEKQIRYDARSAGNKNKARKVLERNHRRVTFLVNIWLNHRPLNCNPFPETMVGNLSKVDLFGGEFSLFHGRGRRRCCREAINSITKRVVVREGRATMIDKSFQHNINSIDKGDTPNDVIQTKKMRWPMVQKDEEWIEALMPLEVVQSQAETGSDVEITWHGGVILGGAGASVR